MVTEYSVECPNPGCRKLFDVMVPVGEGECSSRCPECREAVNMRVVSDVVATWAHPSVRLQPHVPATVKRRTAAPKGVMVPSLSRGGDEAWCVAPGPDGFTCTCPPFTMGDRKGQPCKHIRLYERAVSLLTKCAATHGLRPDGGLCKACLVALLAVTARKVRREYVPKAEAKAKVAAARKRRAPTRRRSGEGVPASVD